MIYRGLVISGTDTGIGKTEVACALLRAFREAGLRVIGVKPVETGCRVEGGELIPADGFRLREAAGVNEPIERIVPYRFRAPLAPAEAARAEGSTIGLDRIFQTFDALAGRYDLIVLESAGGLLVPLNDNFLFADLLPNFLLPVLLVAPNRLGTLNHTLLSIEALRARKVPVLGVVLNQISDQPDPSATSNAESIRRYAKLDWTVQVPFFPVSRREPELLSLFRPLLRELLARLDRFAEFGALNYLS